jgi:fructokinase
VKRWRILSFGEVLWDLLPGGATFGGAPANLAGQAALLGLDAWVLSAVGDDVLGAAAVACLQRAGVQTALIQTTAEFPTGTVGVSVDSAGKPVFEIHTGSAWDEISWSDAAWQLLQTADAFCFGTLSQRGERSRTTLRRLLSRLADRPVLRVLDVNLRRPFYSDELIRDSLAAADVLKLSDEELPLIAQAAGLSALSPPQTLLTELRARYAFRMVAMTAGAQGAILVTSGTVVHQPGIPVQVIDTIGAGDAFTAALLRGLLQEDDPATIAAAACRHAAQSCTHAGALPSVGQHPDQPSDQPTDPR